ncbi:2-oxoglutarate/malate transporter [endosymbiont of Acanthamoeba sp. UWC8]|uniref:DASS family sodium-coupled anion symporter n=1 Tax=endosymbiont of Acanthamoeba sp. UWC8 TaxID=86106 RepID=UPI0004D1439E|nr:DASS family sodium-coupled anion symporter [endosymbiont of Acanthamoeba sp. UWC8]AIF81022.1 2-oxoglutarate/malate transporter [endosymbiont of Acanthamoeba sp. UWC8]
MSSGNINLKQVLLVFILGAVLWNVPAPIGVDLKAWHLFGIFITTIIAIILNPMPIGAIALFSILVCIITHTLTLHQALSAFSIDIAWLVVFAFFISRGFIKTGLGKRIAYYFISKIGKSTLGLSYGLVLTDFILSPMIPSVTARGGGIIFPIAKALSDEYEKNNPSRKDKNHSGGFLIQVCFQSNVVTSAMFLTAMAGNPLVLKLAPQFGVDISWETWALGAIVPGIISLLLIPLVIYLIYPPSVKSTENAPRLAKQALKEMGKITKHEVVMLLTFVLLITLWILDYRVGFNATTTALLGFCILIISGVLSWNDALSEKGAWDTLTWFGTLVMMSGFLKEFGIMAWIGGQIEHLVAGKGMMLTIVVIGLLYFYVHYFFASITAKITVLYSTFLMLLISAGVPKLVSALALAYFSSLAAGLTHYGISSAPVFFGAGYFNTKTWWKVGFLVSLVNLAVWATIGSAWWYALGWW